jgi:uncharacterized membrane protein
MNPTKEQSDIWRKDESNWNFNHLIYHNKDDNRILLPKYYPEMGWTVNFANPKSYLTLFLIPILIIIIILITEKCFK